MLGKRVAMRSHMFPLQYVSATGALRVRVRCTANGSSFYSSGNQLQVVYDRP